MFRFPPMILVRGPGYIVIFVHRQFYAKEYACLLMLTCIFDLLRFIVLIALQKRIKAYVSYTESDWLLFLLFSNSALFFGFGKRY